MEKTWRSLFWEIQMNKEFEVLTRKDDLSVFNGGSLKGYIKTTFKDLCETFGTPTHGPFDQWGDKVTCEWRIVTEDGLHVTIYDWKMGETPMEEYEWHIGGHDFKNVEWVSAWMGIQGWRWR